MSNKELIQEFNDNTIGFVVGQFLTLKKRGSKFIAPCPFHNEKTPSFTVTPSLNICKCYGCGKGGDPAWFVKEIYNLTFYQDAIKRFKDEFLNGQSSDSIATKEKHTVTEIEIVYRIVKKESININSGLWYWVKLGVNIDVLEKLKIYFVRELSVSDGEKVTPRYFGSDVPCFAFDSGEATKLYKPTQKNKHQWVGNTITKDNFFPPLSTFTDKKVKTLYITAGQKDCIVLTSRGYDAVTLTGSETSTITESMADELRSITNDVRIIYDTDSTGKKRAEEISEQHLFTICELPDFEGCKDISDLAWRGIFKKDSTLESIGVTNKILVNQ